MDFLHRTELLYGSDSIKRLKNSTVAVFGLGGVGGHAAEALVRSGIGTLIVIDRDVVDVTNINRQIVATSNTVGRAKVDVIEERAIQINPDVRIIKYNHSFSNDFDIVFDNYNVDAVADSIDDVEAKQNLICYCKKNDIPRISSMGTALRKHPEKLEITDIYKTSYDPLARVMRKRLKDRSIKRLTVLCSTEEPAKKESDTLASSAFVPAAAGLCIASASVAHITGENIL